MNLILFCFCMFIFFYHIFFYGIVLKILYLLKKKGQLNVSIKCPTITILCPAYNEVSVIESKIKSFFKLEYPKDKIKMIIISDDSNDGTNEIVEKYVEKGYLELVVQKPRKGKQSGHNLVEPSITSEYILSTDANSIFKPDSIKKLVNGILSSKEIGIVSGELKLVNRNGRDSGEGFYWKYESLLKKLESNFYSIIGANGSIFLIKRELFTQIHDSSVDDFERTLIVLKLGYKAKYVPDAFVYEDVSEKAQEELKRKIRIISQEWFALLRQRAVFKNPCIAFMLVSHKIIRWTFPLYSICILLTTFFMSRAFFWMILFIIQTLFYFLGIMGMYLERRNAKVSKVIKLPLYILVMNIAAIGGFVKFLKGQQVSVWSTIREVEK